MTISSTTRIAGPFTGNGVTTTFPFTYKVFDAADVQVIRLTISTGIETTLTIVTDYTIALNGDQDSNPGGNIVLVTALLALYTLTATSDIANLQPTDLTNQGGFYPEVITDALDRATIQIQQISDIGDRALKIPISDGVLNMELPTTAQRINTILGFGAAGLPTVLVPQASSITGNTVIVGTLGVTGATTLSSTLGVTGATTIQGLTVGKGAGNITTNTVVGLNALITNSTGTANTAVGNLALNGNTIGSQNTAIGKSALEATIDGNNNTAVGFSALKNINNVAAIQNTCIGSMTGTAITSGNNNTAVGHNTLFTLQTGVLNSAFGQGALAYNVSGNYNCAFGYHSLLYCTGSNNVAYGVESLKDLTSGLNNTAFGYGALKSVVTANSNTAFGYLAGNVITGAQNTCMGDSALYVTTTAAANTAYGYNALVANQTGEHNTAVGAQALISNISGSRNVSLGRVTLINATGSDNTAIGTTALNGCTIGITNTALGGQALLSLTTYNNCTGLGYNSQVTGSNQVQLGDASTTTYAYGAVQNRSDLRDKTDVRSTILGLNFINSLRPVDFKWDLREDYFVKQETDSGLVDKEGNSIIVTRRTNAQKDNSKKRNRFHHGLIAQEVKVACDAANVDFGGYQDHLIKGGEDVLSLGYEELIAPLIKAVQELTARIVVLEAAQ